ncbi:GGDEF domain-containing protein [Congregibacter litoralis]|uniref:diguanylate cyclase n=1 Tax=Congregibacter litoralis KT71 TaxID=314285 RepID=A4ABI4_9GAMM|nr:GGDEF domain-containing protein [Congregibacter litoralis]EAQ96738.1 diguanylate cyclase (GGDEF) domain protein [Congregibacter litoralis KT71]
MTSDPYFSFLINTVLICTLLAGANLMLAVQRTHFVAARVFALAFGAKALTWLLTALLPPDGAQADLSLLLLNALGATGMLALWSGFSLRAGYGVNPWLIGGLFALWLGPVMGVVFLDFGRSAHVPFAAASISIGAALSVWHIYRKRGTRNVGDWALIVWMAVVLPVAVAGMLTGMSSARSDPNTAWIMLLSVLPILFAGLGLFTLVSIALDALHDSNRLARTDGLTGILNRRAFDSELALAVARAERHQRELSLIVLDLDAFKALNDNYGHAAGDAILRAVARIMTETARRIDIVARIGGEELAVILPDTPASAALRLAERLRQAIDAASTDSLAVSASFGVSSIQDTGHDAKALLAAADQALYAAKDGGRNCVRYALEPLREPAELIGLVK